MKTTAYRSVPLVAFAAAVLLLGLWPGLPSQALEVDASDIHAAFDGSTLERGQDHDRQERSQARSSSSSSSSNSRGSARSSSSSSGSSSRSSTSSSSSSGSSSRSSASPSRSSSRSSSGSSRSSTSSSGSSSSSSRSSARTSSSSGSRTSSQGTSSSRTSSRGTTTRSSSGDSGRTTRGTTTRGTTTRGTTTRGTTTRGTTTRSSSGDSGRTTRGTTRSSDDSYRSDRGGTSGRTDTGDPGRTGATRSTRDTNPGYRPDYDRGVRTPNTPDYGGSGGGTNYGPRLDSANEDYTDNYRGERRDRRGYHDYYVYDYPHRTYYCPYDFWYWNFGIGPAGYLGWSWGWDFSYDWPYYGWAWNWPYYNHGYRSPTVFWSASIGWGVHANVAFPIYTPYYRDHYARSDLGGIDLNVNPQDAGVYLNGQYIGVVDEFNGWPGYLWLEEGVYHLVVYKEGFETISREYTIQRGVVLNVRERMNIGVATHPDEVPVPPRVMWEIEAQQQAEEDRVADQDRSEDEWRQRAAEYLARRDAEQYEGSGQRTGTPSTAESMLDARVAPARLNIDAVPADASVYLDGTFLGTAAELASRGGVLVDPGDHILELVRPGYDSKQRTFSVEAGDQLQLTLQLEKAGEEGVAVSSLAP